ncbi:hypothetical protein [Nocardia sp. NPDC049149]|uniref:hypothetical protein n=1 Tax=Nocardia sp. NPDC049149 TaxID=3364315 RepID=UPI0037138F09
MAVKPTALGYVRRDVSGAQQVWDERQMRSLARRLGYDLTQTVVVDATEDRIVELLGAVHRFDAEAVITPNLEHLDGTADAVVSTCDVITVRPENTYARWAFTPHAGMDK